MKTVLLTNGQQRKTLAAARALGAKGIRVLVGEDTRCNPSGFSRYSRFVKSPNAREEPELYYRWLTRTIRNYACDMVFPMDDDAMDVAVSHYGPLSRLCALPIPPRDSYLLAQDKGRSAALAERCGVACPKTITVGSMEELREKIRGLAYPVILKPVHSSGSRGIRLVQNEEELLARYGRSGSRYPFPLIQEYVGQGDRYDVCMLVNENQEVKASFVQKELRHFPEEMGPSTVQESVLYPQLVQSSSEMLAKLPWYGVIEFEYIIDTRDGKPKFMEINPRFWGSLYTALLAGVDFPYLLYKLAEGEEFPSVTNYQTGVRGRWLLPGDLFYFITSKNRFRMEPPLFAGEGHHVRDDILSFTDPMPAFGFMLACFKYAFRADMWKFMFRR